MFNAQLSSKLVSMGFGDPKHSQDMSGQNDRKSVRNDSYTSLQPLSNTVAETTASAAEYVASMGTPTSDTSGSAHYI